MAFLSVICCQGQNQKELEWLSVGTTWYHTYIRHGWEWPIDYGYKKTVVTNEYIIDGNTVKILTQTTHLPGSTNYPDETFMLHQEDNRVYLHLWIDDSEEFTLLYDFNASQGDTIWISEPYNLNEETPKQMALVIDSTYTITIEGVEFLAYNHHLPYDHDWFFHGRSIEHIGWISDIVPYNHWLMDLGYSPGELRCFTSGDFSWQTNPNLPCDTIYSVTVNVEELNYTESEILLFPNPASSLLNISFTTQPWEKITIEVLDVSGRLLIKNVFEPENEIQLNINNLKQGTYFVRAITSNNTFYNTFIKR